MPIRIPMTHSARKSKTKSVIPPLVRDQSAEDVVRRVFAGKIVGGTVSQMATYSDLFTRMPEPIFLLSPEDGSVLEANPAALQVLQIEEKDILGRPLAGWAIREERRSAEQFFCSAFKSDDRSIELRFVAASGKELRLELQLCPVPLADYGHAIQIIARDITQAHRYRTRLEEMNAALEKLSSTDEMTGLRNFRSFKEEMARVHTESTKSSTTYSVIFIDVDHFKKYNDRNGHPAGDEVLRTVAKLLTSTSRKADLPARYGGEEFVILCPNTDASEAMKLAEKVRSAIAVESFAHGEFQPLGHVSASIGVASFPDHGSLAQDVIHNADQALYFSKSEGRDRVTLFGASPPRSKIKLP
ncbi:MAG: diguanylate cyclase [Proteobacteria bacterium]|nr:MAG: diguanylate cyclase [Pseudomonadota bacterium]